MSLRRVYNYSKLQAATHHTRLKSKDFKADMSDDVYILFEVCILTAISQAVVCIGLFSIQNMCALFAALLYSSDSGKN